MCNNKKLNLIYVLKYNIFIADLGENPCNDHIYFETKDLFLMFLQSFKVNANGNCYELKAEKSISTDHEG